MSAEKISAGGGENQQTGHKKEKSFAISPQNRRLLLQRTPNVESNHAAIEKNPVTHDQHGVLVQGYGAEHRLGTIVCRRQRPVSADRFSGKEKTAVEIVDVE
jgi:hypothetical protein